MKSVSFFTNCYEKDWDVIINRGGVSNKIENLNFPFIKKILIINNVKDRDTINSASQRLVQDSIIDNFYFTDDFSDEILRFFNIEKESFVGGYWYWIAPLLSIYLCETDYLVYLTGDTITEKKDYDWISNGIKIILSDDRVKTVNPVWNSQYNTAKDQENYFISLENIPNKTDDEWFYGAGFSDQCFLIPTGEFKKQIYNETNELSDIYYPIYAGNSFEKRISSYLMNNKYWRITSNNITYFHPRYF